MKKDLYLVVFVSALLLAGLIAALIVSDAEAETAYACVSNGSYLNARAYPRKSAEVTMHLYNGDEVQVVGFHGDWVQIVGGESGTSYCKAKYLSEIRKPVTYTNTSGGRVRIRESAVDGKGVGWIEAGKSITVTKQLLGWGYTKAGWVDLSYFE